MEKRAGGRAKRREKKKKKRGERGIKRVEKRERKNREGEREEREEIREKVRAKRLMVRIRLTSVANIQNIFVELVFVPPALPPQIYTR